MVVRLVLIMFVAAMTAFSQQMLPIEPGVSHELAKWRAARYSDVRYKLNLTLEKMSPVLKGTMEIRVKLSEPVPTPMSTDPTLGADASAFRNAAIILDWRKIRGNEQLSAISNVSINGQSAISDLSRLEVYVGPQRPPKPGESPSAPPPSPADNRPTYLEQDDHLIFRDGVVAGENVIKLDFTSPILTSGSAITRYVDKEDGAEYIYSLFVPSDASTAFPVFDQPDLKAMFNLGILAPDGWRVVSNEHSFNLKDAVRVRDEQTGAITEIPNEKGKSYFDFFETKPISTYVFAFAAGPFERFDERNDPETMASDERLRKRGINMDRDFLDPRIYGKPASETVNVYVRKSQSEKFKGHAKEVRRLNREGIKFLESYFDYKFPFPKYDIVLIPEFPFGGMEHAGATFLRESSVIFPQEPTKNDYISRANVIFHEAAHQWFGDTVTMKWFDDLWLKEGFAEFMAYKTLEKVMPEYNAWKVFYERNKQAAYLTDSTKGTTPIYQEIANLNSAKSAYGNIVYRKAPSFLKQAEFYLGPDKFQTAVRAFLKKHEYANAGWEDLVKEFANQKPDQYSQVPNSDISPGSREQSDMIEKTRVMQWAMKWVKQPGAPFVRALPGENLFSAGLASKTPYCCVLKQSGDARWPMRFNSLSRNRDGSEHIIGYRFMDGLQQADEYVSQLTIDAPPVKLDASPVLFFPNYQDYGYGIFLLDPKSRDYVLKNIGSEKDDFLRTMMWGSLWDSVREGELDPKEYVELVVKNLKLETDESTIQTLLGRVSTAMRYYIDAKAEPPASAGGQGRSEPPALAGATRGHKPARKQGRSTQSEQNALPNGRAYATDLQTRVENLLIDRMQNAATPGQKITYYRSFLNIASSENARRIMKVILRGNAGISAGKSEAGKMPAFQATKDRFDIVSRLIILGDPEAPKLLADLEKSETSDEAKRYAYAAKAGFATAENKAKFWNDFVANKDISESWIEAAFGPFNNVRHSELTLPYLEKALAELPNLKRNRKIFFVNGWLGAFIGGQKNEQALAIVNKFLADNPGLDKDLRLKILENVDVIERAVKIRIKFAG